MLTIREEFQSNCVADRIYNYYQAGCKRFGMNENINIIEAHKDLRASLIYGYGLNPISVGASMCYLNSVLEEKNITQHDIERMYGISGGVLRPNIRKLISESKILQKHFSIQKVSGKPSLLCYNNISLRKYKVKKTNEKRRHNNTSQLNQ
jgi:hypothetical protein